MEKDETTMDDLRDILHVVAKGQNKLEGRMDENESSMNDLRDMMQILIGGQNKFEQTQNKFEQTQNKLVLDMVEVKEMVKDHTKDIKEMKENIVEIKGILEKDAKKQKDYEEEHVANVSAHDRFEKRITRTEKELKLDPIYS